MKSAPQPPLARLLFRCARLLDELAQAEINREAGARVVRPGLMRLLPHLDFDGVRPSELARRVDVSKQAVGQALTEMEAQGLVAQVADADDARAIKVRLTKKGAVALAHGGEVLAFFEAQLASEVGAAPVDAVARGLGKIVKVLEAWQKGDAPARPLPRREKK